MRTQPARTRRPRVTTLPQLLATAVETNPTALAVLDGASALTYAQLDAMSSRWARLLIGRGVGPGALVAVGVPRSWQSWLAVWAVAKTGAGFVPVDPKYPAERIAHIVSDSGCRIGLTVRRARATLPSGVDWLVLDDPESSPERAGYGDEPLFHDDRLHPVRGTDIAYVIYTSGSTGLPKGVAVTQAGLAVLCAAERTRYRGSADARILSFSSPSFDISIGELLLAIGSGGALVVAGPDIYGGAELTELVAREAITHILTTPSVAASLDPTVLPEVRVLVVGGEACPPELVRRWRTDTRALVNAYGPTETTVVTNISDPLDPDGPLTIGPPFEGVSEWVLDENLRPRPAGVSGELYVAGAQVARGYLGRPDLTAARFVACPWVDGARMYRTGDIVRLLPAGPIEYLGRNDFQVKIRGFRIELGEIDAVLAAHDSVDFAVTVGHQLAAGGVDSTVLAAYLLPNTASPNTVDFDVDALLAHARRHLPAHMVPASITVLDELPLTPTGKLDLAALPDPVFTVAEFRAPSTDVEQVIADVFAQLLGVARVGLDDDFFALGGNSLLATHAAARIRTALAAEFPARMLFETGTVAALAAVLAPLVGLGSRPALLAHPRPDRIPLSPAQQRMWFLNQFDTASVAYSIPIAVRLTGVLDGDALRAAVGDVIARHEVLRTIYPQVDGAPVQVVLPVGSGPAVSNLAVSGQPAAGQPAADLPAADLPAMESRTVAAAEVTAAIGALCAASFDVTHTIPLRVALFTLADAPDEAVLALVVHHIAADGVSTGPLVRDLMTAYAARTAGAGPDWAPLPIQYADYSIWQQQVLGAESDPESLAAEQIAYWSGELAGLAEQAELPVDRPRPPVQSFAGGWVPLVVDAATHQGLADLARSVNGSLFMAVRTAFAVLLGRLSGGDDIAIGSPVSGRGEPELDDLIGMFVNTLVFRTRLRAGEPFTELLARQRDTDLAAFGNADVPFERLVEVLNPTRSQARHPLFQVGFSFQNFAKSVLELPGLTAAALDADGGVSQFDLHLIVTDSYADDGAPAGISGILTYAADLFDEATARGFADRFARLLAAIVADPHAAGSDIDLLDAAERASVLYSCNDTDHPDLTATTLAQLFADQVAAHSHRPALVAVPHRLDYADFGARVFRLARWLIAHGVGPEVPVALRMPRGVDLVVGMYAVIAAGGVYVPLDPAHPADRIGYILDTVAPRLTLESLDTLELSEYAAGPIADGERIAPLRPDNAAYVIFTSGSTGKPKGVAVSHAAIVNQLRWKANEFALTSDDAILLKTAATFDLSVWEFLSPIVSGAALVIAKPDGQRDAGYLVDLMRAEHVSVLHVVPSMLDVLTTIAGKGVPTLRVVLAIGEALPAVVAQRFTAANPAAQLWNLYGPTEAAVSITAHRVTSADQTSVPIGLPEWNSQVYVLDARLRPVPVGVAGELYLAGAQLARGYLNRADLTADRFVANPFAEHPAALGARMYRTGDVVRRMASGELDYLGRVDFQVKVRGFRIELEEIEQALRAQADIAQAVVVAHTDKRLGDLLVGYVVAATELDPREQAGVAAAAELDPREQAGVAAAAELDPSELAARLGRTLPSYMVPSMFVQLEAMPLNINGKIDRKALPAPTWERQEFRAPETPFEQAVAGVFGEVLGIEEVGLDDDFFALGGNSLLATQVAARLSAVLDTDVAVRAVFDTPTVAGLAVHAVAESGSGRRPALTPRPRPERIPLAPAQRRMWFLNQLDTWQSAYNIPSAARISGHLDIPALRAAVGDLIERHENLRTRYPQTDDGPYQVIEPLESLVPTLEPIVVTDEAELSRRVAEFAWTPFDVANEVPFRFALFQLLGPDAGATPVHVVLFGAHHIAADGWSMGPMVRDAMAAYTARARGEQPTWAPLPLQYADYALWCAELLGAENDPDSMITAQLQFWKTALADLPAESIVPTDYPRPLERAAAGGQVRITVPADVRRGLERLARSAKASMYMVMHTALAVFVGRMSGANDVAIGSPVAGRGSPELDDLIGMFVNTIVLRTRFRGSEPFGDVLARQREWDLGAFANLDVPFDRLVDELVVDRSMARPPLFQVALAYQNLRGNSFSLPGLEIEAYDLDTDLAKFDLSLIVHEWSDVETGPTLEGVFAYSCDLFDHPSIVALRDRFAAFLRQLAADPGTPVGDLSLVSDTERAQLIDMYGGAARPGSALPALPGLTALLPEILTAAVGIGHPDRPAIVDGDRTASYRELDAAAAQLARLLIERGIGADSVVALSIPRSIESVVAVWAVAKTGAAFVPVDPRYPAERIAHMLLDSGAVLGLTSAAVADTLPEHLAWLTIDSPELRSTLAAYSALPVSDSDRIRAPHPADTAYLIYTSGSTGLPKGVAVTHAGLGGFSAELTERFGVKPADRTLHFASPSFDASILELLLAFGAGATMVIASPEIYGGAELADLLRREQVSHAFITPAVLAGLAADLDGRPEVFPDLRVIATGGEACGPDLVRRWLTACPDLLFFNAYGPTEATVAPNISAPLRIGGPVTIGGPIPGVTEWVLDSRLHPVPMGVAGELYVAGTQLARGYHRRPALTADRFVACPWLPGTRMYRTGDIVRWVAGDVSGASAATGDVSGASAATGDIAGTASAAVIEYVGRNDFQVKIRGFRIELGEIDAVLLGHPDVDFAITIGRTLDTGATVLAAYIRLVAGTILNVGELVGYAEQRLASHMVPAAIVVMDTMPLTPAGKLDRNALPEPVFAARTFRVPRNRIEQAVADVYAAVLGVDRVGLDDDFFALGGNSLQATQVVKRLGSALDATVMVRYVFGSPVVAELAVALAPLVDTGGRAALMARPRPARIPLSPAQQRMWFLNQFDTASAVYTVPLAVRLSGDLDVEALRAAVADVIGRHEILRTVYPSTEDGPVQVVLPADRSAAQVAIERVTSGTVLAAVSELVHASFDVTAQVPLHVALYQLTDTDEWVLALVVHHIAADGASLAPLTRDLMTAYAARSRTGAHAGGAPEWAPLSVQYADYSLWLRALLGREDDPESLAARQLGYWSTELAGLAAELELPGARRRPAVQSFAGDRCAVTVPAELHRGLAVLARAANATVFMVVHTAFAVLLARLSGSDDVAVGSPISGRGESRLDDLIGMFVNTLVLRTRLDPAEPFSAVLARQRETDLAAFANADVPFERLVEVLNPVRSQARHPLFQVGFSFQNFARAGLDLPNLTVAGLEADTGISQFDLNLILADTHTDAGTPAGIGGVLTYATALFDAATARGFVDRFVALLTAIVADPDVPVGDIELLDPAERAVELLARNNTRHQVVPETLLDGYRRMVAAYPDAVAVRFGGEHLTYAGFDARVNRLARYLISHGVGPESLVALSMRRSLELVIGMYAVLTAGGAYVPIDPDHPADRIGHVLDTAQPVLVLTGDIVNAEHADYAAAAIDDAERRAPLRPGNTAYVIFTSGSTGRPKGVAVSHAAIHNQIDWMLDQYPMGPADVYLQKTATTFDVSLWGFFMPLRAGATLLLATPDGHRDPEYLTETIAAHQVTVTDFVPSMLTVFAGHTDRARLTSLREVFVIGEALPPETVAAFAAVATAGLHNLYGPTEAAVSVTYWPAGPADVTTVPIGSPQWNTQVYVLDRRLRPVPAGVVGELYLAGDQLARGYLARPDLTADRFLANPYGTAGARMYRTGDLVRVNPAGALDYLGRTDFQVKFRGQRIELGDIETALLAEPNISQAVAVPAATGTGDVLVAYLVPAGAIDVGELPARLATTLPHYMIPGVFMVLDEFPLNSSGKLDRKALPPPVFAAKEFRSPSTVLEQAVAAVYREVLGVEHVGLDDDFFTLGGNSLIAIQAAHRLRASVDAAVTVQWFFVDSTVAGMAARVERATDPTDRTAALAVLLPIRARGTRPPLFTIHPMLGLSWCYTGLARYLDADRPIYGVQSPVIASDAEPAASVAQMAAHYVEEIRSAQPNGPYHLAGYSVGAVIAHEIAVLLRAAGEQVALLAMLDGHHDIDPDENNRELAAELAAIGIDVHPDRLADLSDEDLTRLLAYLPAELAATSAEHRRRIYRNAVNVGPLVAAHQPGVFDGTVEYFRAAAEPRVTDAIAQWSPFAATINDHPVDAVHAEMTSAETYARIGPTLDRLLTN